MSPQFSFCLVSKTHVGERGLHTIESPIRRSTQRCTFSPHTQTVDFRRIQPRNALPSDAEKDIVQEKERDGRGSDLFARRVACFLVVSQQHRDDQVTEALPSSAVHHELSSAPALDVWNGDETEQ